MMEETVTDLDAQEADEPTLPYSRKAIDQLARDCLPALAEDEGAPDQGAVAAAPKAILLELDDDDWFELAGRRIRVSLAALAHIGSMGTPTSMISSQQFCVVAGEFFCPAADRDVLEYEASMHRSLAWRLALAPSVLLMLALPLLLRLGEAEPAPLEPPTEAKAAAEPDHPGAASPAQPTPPRVPVPPRAPEVPAAATPANAAPAASKSPRDSSTAACVAQRRDAENALHGGQWLELEVLTRRKRCWSKSRVPTLLRMRALFELERFGECVELGEGDRSNEVGKWQKNCSRALQ